MPMLTIKTNDLLRNNSNQFLSRSRILLLSLLFGFLLTQSNFLVADEQFQDLGSIEEAVRLFLGPNGSPQKLDPRLLLKKCYSKLDITYPFNTKTTTQVQCNDTNGWKIYLSVTTELTPDASNKIPEKPSAEKVSAIQTGMGVISTRVLRRGIPISANDLEVIELPTTRLTSGHYSKISDLIAMEPNQTIPKGTLVSVNMVDTPKLVKKGEKVTILFNSNGLTVSNEGESLENGELGQRIKVFLPKSNKVIEGIVDSRSVIKVR